MDKPTIHDPGDEARKEYTLQDILARVGDPKPEGQGHMAFCPSHDDGVKHGRRSLSITEKDGKVLLHCFAGCEYRTIIETLGLGGKNAASRSAKAAKRVTAEYAYQDTAGKTIAEIVRYEPKDFRVRRPDGRGGWIWNKRGLPALLYHLPEMLAAVARGKTVFVCEGEKSCDAAKAIGIVACSNAFGAGKWTQAHADYFPPGTKVRVLPDNDDCGRAHAATVVKTLQARGCKARILTLPGLPEKGDIVEWIAAGGTKEKLIELIRAMPKPEEEAAPETVACAKAHNDEPFDTHKTDSGNTTVMLARHGHELRYCPELGWLEWNGKIWTVDSKGGCAIRRAQETIRSMWEEACEMPHKTKEEGKLRDAEMRWAKQCENAARLLAMRTLGEAQSRIQARVEDFDTDPDLFNCQNGMIDLTTGELLPHIPTRLMTMMSPVSFDPSAKAPRFERFLSEVFAGNRAIIEFVQRWAGYCLYGKPVERKFVIAWGSGHNGKSRLLRILGKVFGQYGVSADAALICDTKKGSGPQPEVARLRGVRLVSSVETGEGRRFNAEVIKKLTGDDEIPTRNLYKPIFHLVPAFKVVLATNFKPVCDGADSALFGRILLLPFEVSFTLPRGQTESAMHRCPDPDLDDALDAELPGILAWAVRGCLAWRADGLCVPEEVKFATSEYRKDMDTVGNFLADHCVVDRRHWISGPAFRKAYKTFCEGLGEKPLGAKLLKANLVQRSIRDEWGTVEGKKARGWRGVALRESGGDPTTSPGTGERERTGERHSKVPPIEHSSSISPLSSSMEGESHVTNNKETGVSPVPCVPELAAPPLTLEKRQSLERSGTGEEAGGDVPGAETGPCDTPESGSSVHEIQAWAAALPEELKIAWRAALAAALRDSDTPEGGAYAVALEVFRRRMVPPS